VSQKGDGTTFIKKDIPGTDRETNAVFQEAKGLSQMRDSRKNGTSGQSFFRPYCCISRYIWLRDNSERRQHSAMSPRVPDNRFCR